MNKYVAFDIEIARSIPEDCEDWKELRPLGITCAAAYSSDGRLWNWYANDNGEFTARMSPVRCYHMALELAGLVNDGYSLLTWNGLGFDFDILAEESGQFDLCKSLALNHIDMMFHFLCLKGYPLGLDAAAKGMGLPGKPEGMTGTKAPELWAAGEYHRVLDYVSWDVKNTLMLAQAVDERGGIKWTSLSGNAMAAPISRWRTVKEALTLPQPDTSWMTDPMTREQFYGWTNE